MLYLEQWVINMSQNGRWATDVMKHGSAVKEIHPMVVYMGCTSSVGLVRMKKCRFPVKNEEVISCYLYWNTISGFYRKYWEKWKSIGKLAVFTHKLQAAFQSCGLQLAQASCYIYWVGSYAVQFPALTDTQRSSHFRDTAAGLPGVIVLECQNSHVGWLRSGLVFYGRY
jgi:hypothetical protein